jgi:lipopolysaccharide export system protein LptA
MRRARELAVVLALVTTWARAQVPETKPSDVKPPDAKAPDAKGGDAKAAPGFFGLRGGHSKEPITITSDNLEYEYKDGIVVYRGDVLAVQGDLKIKSNELRITLARADDGKQTGAKAASELEDTSASKLQSVVATGNVRIDQGTRWAVGGKATFDQSNRTLVLTENPVLHDGPNEVVGDRVVVYLDEDRSVVEGGRKRVKAVLFPGKQPGADGKAAASDAGKTAASDATKTPEPLR